jgi:ribosomal protein L19
MTSTPTGFNTNLKPIRNFPHEPSSRAACIDPVKAITEQQLKVLDPKGVRTRLFSAANPERVQPGDILLVRLKSGDPFSGVCITIRRRNSPIDTAILLRNALTRVGVEMWYKVYSPNVEGIEIVQRAQRKARRNKLTYMRKPKHDMGSVEKIVQAYQKNRVGGPSMGSSQSRNRKGKEGGGKQAKKN